MLKKLGDIVTGDNTNRNVAGSNHFEGCLVVSFAKNAFDLWRKQQGGRSFWICVGRQHEGAQDVGISIFLNGTIINGIQMRGNIPA